MMLASEVLLGRSTPVRHAFFTREGGVSAGRYASLNCGLGSGDDPERVRINRSVAMRRLGFADHALITAYQVHSARVAIVETPWPEEARPHVDGMVTRRTGVALGILTADCAPVLLADAHAGVIGAAHAGWRGAKSGVLAATVAAMLRLGARLNNIRVAIGPCIRYDSYEVGREFQALFAADEPAAADLFRPSHRQGHYHFDLAGYVERTLRVIGVEHVCLLPHDTFADEQRFFSYRRATLRGDDDYGRLLSAIGLG